MDVEPAETLRINDVIPFGIRRWIKLRIRAVKDVSNGLRSRFAKLKRPASHEEVSIHIKQRINPGETLQNKLSNIRLAAAKIDGLIIKPGEIFSYWHLIGNPSVRNGFKEGRNVVAGELTTEVGGGLCQLSGIIYHLSLKSGMRILERHNHSVDIYSEDERYTPLGSDATVVFGYKDLRFENITNSTLILRLEVMDAELRAGFVCKPSLVESKVAFKRSDHPEYRMVETTVDGKLVAVSHYLLPVKKE